MAPRIFGLFCLTFAVAGVGPLLPLAHGQTSYPMLMSLKPVAAQAGQTSEHTINSRYSLDGAYQVLVSGTGVVGEIVPPAAPEKPAEKPDEKLAAKPADGDKKPAESEKKSDDAKKKPEPEKKPELLKLQVRFTVAPDAELGVRDYRVVTPRGVSTVGQLVIARDPVVLEAAKNDTPEQAQVISLPATVCGAIEKAEDVDYYKFHVDAGVALSFHTRSGRLQDRIHDLQTHCDPILKLRTAAGVTLASSDNHFYADPLLTYKFEQAGDYLLEIRDVRYEGNAYWEYSIEINDRPFVENVFPLGVAPGQTTQLELIGYHLPAPPAAACATPGDSPLGARWVRLPMGDQNTNPAPVVVSKLPLVLETDADNNSAAGAQPISVPCGVNGRIQTESDVDLYVLEAKKGESFAFEVVARRRQSSLDSNLRVLNEKGVQVAANDDMKVGRRNSSDSAIENWTAPADGKYFVEIRDVHLRGGSQFPYFLEVTHSEPGFSLLLDTDKTQVVAGGAAVTYCKVERRNGFVGEVQLHVEGLPPQITATCGRILNDKNADGMIVFEATPDAPLVVADVKITGSAVHKTADGQELTLTAVAEPYQETYLPGGGRGHWPVDTHTVAVVRQADILGVKLSDYDVTLKPGESKKIEVTIERAADFKANVTLDMLFQHLASKFGNTLPPGVTLDDKQAKTLLASGATQGFVTLKAAKDAPPVERQLASVMAHVSLNFVMKTTFSSRPVWITVLKGE